MIKIYYIDKDYINYLKKFEKRVPNTQYATNERFFIEIKIKNSKHKYYAPISSFNQKQYTNLLFKNNKNEVMGSIRFSYMIPAPKECVKLVDLANKEEKYRNYLSKNIRSLTKINKRTQNFGNFIYNERVKGNDEKLKGHSIDFRAMETLCSDYKKEIKNEKIKRVNKNKSKGMAI